jgi:hypothetical protein
VPDDLFTSNISTGHAASEELPPSAWLSPVIDGEVTSYFEWLAAGRFDVTAHQGAMHQTGATGRTLTRVLFGFSRSHLFVRLDGDRPLVDLLAEGYRFSLTFLHPSRRLDITSSREAIWSLGDHQGGPVRMAAGSVLELAVALQDLDARAGDPLAFYVSVTPPNAPGGDAERYPAVRAIQIEVPGPTFAADHWRA